MPSAAAMRRRRKSKKQNPELESGIFRLEDDDGSSHAQRIVRELYFRYERQLQRWKDYRNLFLFLGFVSLFLAVLYVQRNASVAYEVHSTLEAVIVPGETSMQDHQQVYDWLNGILTEVWVDPVCGDGICEDPFEFASYSRFGCRADCGKLADNQNLTVIQIDLYFDFSHPIGSLPASDLMQQTTWNLCPVSITVFSSNCYFNTDQSFTSLSGRVNTLITDAPDGNWTLKVTRDIFNKVRGAVRDTTKVLGVGYFYKLYIAAAAAQAERSFEISLLKEAEVLGTKSLFQYVDTILTARNLNLTDNSTYAAFQLGQLEAASCQCGGTLLNATDGIAATWGDNSTFALSNTADPNFPANPTLFNYSAVTWAASAFCAAGPASTPPMLLKHYYKMDNASQADIPWVPGTPAPVNSTLFNQTEGANTTEWCNFYMLNLTSWQTNMTKTVQQILIDKRLGNQVSTGKIARRISVLNALQSYIVTKMPELTDPVINLPKGTNPDSNQIAARLDFLTPYFVDGPIFSRDPQIAANALRRSQVYTTPLPDLIKMSKRATARVIEVELSGNGTGGITIQAPADGYPNNTMTITQLVTIVLAAGGNNSFLPASTLLDSPQLIKTSFAYDVTSWQGNTTAYMRCNLPGRGESASKFVGFCKDLSVTCDSTILSEKPFNCTYLADGADVVGDLTVTQYRNDCETPCDRSLDCKAVCECYDTCSGTQYCECPACEVLDQDASRDVDFIVIKDIAKLPENVDKNPGNGINIAPTTGGRRSLQQTTVALQLDNVLKDVSTVSGQQSEIGKQMTDLQSSITQANTIAQNRANDPTLVNLINAGRADIAAGQKAVDDKLNQILDLQNEALAAAAESTKALQNIESLSEQSLAQAAALEQAVTSQLTAIKTATQTGTISLSQALALWKRTRRDKLQTSKASQLSNLPCTTIPTVDHAFNLDNNNTYDTDTSRERNVGLTNRVIAGMLLHQHRTEEAECPDSKFDKIQRTCTGPNSIIPFGVDPIFKLGTDLYKPALDDGGKGDLSKPIYNCTNLQTSTYDIYVNQTGLTTNKEPFCAELYNARGLPYAFHHFPLQGKMDGFPVYFDINLAADDAQLWYKYISEGLYLDGNTRSMTAEIVTYNAQLRIFGYFFVDFFFGDGGSISVTHRTYTVKVELYNGSDDTVRFVFEIILTLWIAMMLAWQVYQIVLCHFEDGNFLYYFASGWAWVDLLSNWLLGVCIVIWWIFVSQYAATFDMNIRYGVYDSLTPIANFLALNTTGGGALGDELVQAWSSFQSLQSLIDLLNWYYALNGINILLLIARVLKLMDFQPRLGVVTRSLWLAGPDLIHFAIVFFMVFIGYAMMGHLIFGNSIPAFSSFGESINTCFIILLGVIDVNDELRDLGGLQSVAGALFFWTYELLVFMVLLNFLLAIIVDAFSVVKEKTHETVGIHTELFQLLRDKWRSLYGRMTKNYISDEKLGTLLKQWAGEGKDDDDDQIDESRERMLNVLNEELNEDDLRDILNECLKDAPHEDGGGDEAAAVKGRPQSLADKLKFWQKNKSEAKGASATSTTKEEIALAAKYILERFGKVQQVTADQVTNENRGIVAGDETADMGGGETGMVMMGAGGAPRGLEAVEKERDQLASALERLADVQRELADGQRNLMVGQKQLAEQQGKLVGLMSEGQAPP